MALHLVGAPLLLWRRTRLATFCVYAFFHGANAMFFNIGIFPWLTIAATTIFFAPDWPHRLARWALGRFEELPPRAPAPRVSFAPLSGVALAALAAWVAVQVALPLRASAFDSEVRWSGDGHRFSWRMRIYDRQAEGTFVVTADGEEWRVDPADYLTERQASKMLVRSDMVHQFAQHLESVWMEAGYAEVAVRAEISKSLNGRPPQPFVDPEVDLTAERVRIFTRDAWVMPLEEPVWGIAQNWEQAMRTDVAMDWTARLAPMPSLENE